MIVQMEEILLLILVIGANGQEQEMPPMYLEPKPDRCNKPAEFMYRQCCVFPPFFTRDIAKMCGAVFQLVRADKVHNITALRRHPLSVCEHWKCVLEKYDLVNQDETLNNDKYYHHLDRWTELNKSFSEVMGKAKAYCLNNFRTLQPLNVCEFFNFQGCIRNFINIECPELFPTKECLELQLFYKECREFYL